MFTEDGRHNIPYTQPNLMGSVQKKVSRKYKEKQEQDFDCCVVPQVLIINKTCFVGPD